MGGMMSAPAKRRKTTKRRKTKRKSTKKAKTTYKYMHGSGRKKHGHKTKKAMKACRKKK